jgi:Raf kinase inhibitor-like YbhB/YbcL family protein
MNLTSTAFKEGEMIPAKYTCDGVNISPPLDLTSVPPTCRSLALIVYDPDAPGGTFLHCMAWNIPLTEHFKENEIHGIHGRTDFGNYKYGGPCPPSGTHRYYFKVYALKDNVNFPDDITMTQFEKQIGKYSLAEAVLMGVYKRRN